jgi:adenylate kinase
MSESKQEGPNILITGTPGTGKSRLASMLTKSVTGLRLVEVSKLALDKNLIEEFDTARGVPVINEDAVLDEMEPLIAHGNVLVEYHSSDFFPKRFFDRVIVLTTDNTVLYDRLMERGYPDKKIRENVESEIFRVAEEEALESYDEDVVKVYKNDVEANLSVILEETRAFIEQWREEHS